MQQTFYIESDEEIISVIGKLRKSPSEVNYFVLPKRAILVQSIVNLRLFQREADKLGKKIILVTQDEIGQNLAAKVGIETEHYSDEFSERKAHLELTSPVPEAPLAPKPLAPTPVMTRSMPRSDSIGSSEFNSGATGRMAVASSLSPLPATEVPAPTMDDMRLRIRTAGPSGQTSLNSKRESTEGIRLAPQVNRTLSPQMLKGPQSVPPLVAPAVPSEPHDPRLQKFFAPSAVQSKQPINTPPLTKAPAQFVAPVQGRSARNIFLVIGALSLVTLAGVGAYLFFPKAEIHVTPFVTEKTVTQEYEGSMGTFVSGTRSLPVRLIEKEITVTFSDETTGAASSSNQKARGTVTITNSFSADPQPLVATTRFEDQSGKIFRLSESVTVPGVSGGNPGTIVANVIADQSGSEYNIEPATFTIPGFKGSPKFDKISAQSSKAMAGGGSGGTEMRAVAQADLDRAEERGTEAAKNDFLSQVSGELSGGERLLEAYIQVAPVGTASLLPVGTLANSFDYQRQFRVRAFAIPEDTIRKEMFASGALSIENVNFEPKAVTLSYEGTQPQFDLGRILIKANGRLTLESVIDTASLQEKILGQDEAGIGALLTEYPEIKKIEVRFDPQGLVSTVPKNADRVTIVRDPAQE